jgi:hypothetical protein
MWSIQLTFSAVINDRMKNVNENSTVAEYECTVFLVYVMFLQLQHHIKSVLHFMV